MTTSKEHDNAGEAPAALQAQQSWRRFRSRVLPALRVVLAGLILAGLANWIGPEEILARFGTFPLPVALSCVLLALLVQVLAGLRLGLLAKSQRLPISTGEALSINLSAVFYGLFLPGGNATGWAVRLFRMSAGPAGVATAFLVLAGDRALATVTGAGIGVVADSMLKGPAAPGVSVLLVAVTAVAGWLTWALLISGRAEVLAQARKLPGIGWFASLIRDRGRLPRRPNRGLVVLGVGLSLAVHAVSIVIWVWLAWSLGLNVDVLTIAWVRSASLIVGLLPVTIGGLGLREGAVVYLLTGLGVDGADALSLSLLAFSVTVLAVSFVGGLAEAGRLLVQRSESKG